MILISGFADKLKEMRGFLNKLPTILFFGILAFPPAAFCQVDTAWVRRYSGPGNVYDAPAAIAVDDSGNVYVTGYSQISEGSANSAFTTIKYDRFGNRLWLRQHPGFAYANALILDSGGNVYVTGLSVGMGEDYTTIKYDSQGNQLWLTRYNSPFNGEDWANEITIDEKNNVYVTGGSDGANGKKDIATVKYDPNGNQLWVARYNGPLDQADHGYFMTIDQKGNVYVIGHSEDSSRWQKEWVTIKYDSLGQEQWVRLFSLWSKGQYNAPTGIKFDPSGNVVVTGGSEDSLTHVDYVTIKYDSLGNILWMARENGPSNGWDWATALDLDAYGNIYVSGYSDGDSARETATIKYDSNGNKLWEHRYSRPGNAYGVHSSPIAIKVKETGKVYIATNSLGIGINQDYDFTTIILDSMGQQLWVALYDGSQHLWDLAFAMAVDNLGNVYVTGESDPNGNFIYDFVTIKYSPLPALKGDLNLDGVLTMADVVLMLNFAYYGDPFQAAPSAGDFNCDGLITAADVVIMLQIFFLSAPPLC